MKSIWHNIKGSLLLLSIFIFVFAIDIIAVYVYYNHVKNFIHSQPEEVTADAGIIFFGDYLQDGSDLGPNSKNRANKAIAMYRSEKFRNIICVGGYYVKYWQNKPHHMRNYLIKNGIPSEIICNDSLSYNTITNWYEAKKIMQSNHFQNAIAISDPLHIFRISCMIEDTNIYYASFFYTFEKRKDYWILFKNVHHEFASHLLSFLLHEKLRNKIVYIYHNIIITANKVFQLA